MDSEFIHGKISGLILLFPQFRCPLFQFPFHVFPVDPAYRVPADPGKTADRADRNVELEQSFQPRCCPLRDPGPRMPEHPQVFRKHPRFERKLLAIEQICGNIVVEHKLASFPFKSRQPK